MAAPRNMLSGYAEPAHINDFMFEQQRRTFATYGKVIRLIVLTLTSLGVMCVCMCVIITFIFWLFKFINLNSFKKGSIFLCTSINIYTNGKVNYYFWLSF